jgi:catechol 2,3-dioxygenase-like lactoylglutathione lyase family enzyme
MGTKMPIDAEYVHTNLIALDWKKLADFYIEVFGCVPVYPGRDLSGDWLDRACSLKNARIRGIHLRLPGYGETGPTLEIFQYTPQEKRRNKLINSPGFAHIAFRVEDVASALETMKKKGAKPYGEVVTKNISGVGEITFVYARDPEGNIIELQKWLV